MAGYDPITQTKLCKACGERKPVGEFYSAGERAVLRADKWGSTCKPCQKTYYAERYRTDPAIKRRLRAYWLSERGLAVARAKGKQASTRARAAKYREQRRADPVKNARHQAWTRAYWQKPEQKERAKAALAKRRALKAAAGGSFTQGDIERIRRLQRDRCAICRKKLTRDYHIDHITPISRGGSSYPANLQLLCPPCNHRKHARDPIDYMQSLGRLL